MRRIVEKDARRIDHAMEGCLAEQFRHLIIILRRMEDAFYGYEIRRLTCRNTAVKLFDGAYHLLGGLVKNLQTLDTIVF